MRLAEQEIAQRDRVLFHELVALEHRPAQERRDVSGGGEVVPEDNVALLYPLPRRASAPTPPSVGGVISPTTMRAASAIDAA